MPDIDSALHTLKGTSRPAASVLAVLALASFGLTACGGSSGSTTASQTSAAVTSAAGASTPTTGASRPGGAPTTARPRFQTIRECLRKNGVTLPTPGSGGPAGGTFFRAGGAGGPQLPKGVTRAQFEAALKKCGGGNFAGAGLGRRLNGPGFSRAGSPVFRQALATFAACLRQNGVNVPAPDTSGKGPIFSTKGIKTNSPQFRAATMKCRGALIGAFRHASGAGAAPGAAGRTPGG
jgi:hypothetical protein